MSENTDLDEVWLVVSPHNPHKSRQSLANDYDRLHLVELAIEQNPKLRACDIEFELSKPSYTSDTLAFLKEKYPQTDFVLIMGGDNLATFHKWKNYEHILNNYPIYIYKRPNYVLGDLANHPQVHLFDVPMMEISSTFIRNQIRAQKSIRYLVTENVRAELEQSGLYTE